MQVGTMPLIDTKGLDIFLNPRVFPFHPSSSLVLSWCFLAAFSFFLQSLVVHIRYPTKVHRSCSIVWSLAHIKTNPNFITLY